MVYTQKDLIKLISEESGYYQNAVKDIFSAFTTVINNLLLATEPEDATKIKLFDGLTIETKYYPEREVKNPRTGEIVVTTEHVYPHAKFTPAYLLKFRGEWEGQRK